MEEIARQRELIKNKKVELNIGNEEFAKECGLTGGTIQKFLSGATSKLTDNTKNQIDKKYQLGLSTWTGVARSELGSYSRASVDVEISGNYTTIRMSPSEDDVYYAYETRIKWSEPNSCLIFEEINRAAKNQHSGNVAVFPFSNILHFFTSSKNGHGYRLINVKRNVNDKKMLGFVLTLFDPDLLPMVSPIVYVKGLVLGVFGSIRAGDDGYEVCKNEIAQCLHTNRSKLLLPSDFNSPNF